MFRLVGAVIFVILAIPFALLMFYAGVVEWFTRAWSEWNEPSDEEGWW